MLAFDRSRLSRPILVALGCGALLGFGGCGGAASGELGGDFDGFGGDGDSGRTGSTGGSGGSSGSTGGNGGASGSVGGRGGRGGTGSAGTGAGAGGASGSFGGVAGFSGSAGSFAGGGGFSGSAGAAGSAGSSSMPGPSVCVDLSSGLAGLPSQAFPAEDAMVREYCGATADEDFVFQAVCLPAPGNGQSCTSLYPDALLTLFYRCGGQTQADFLCGPHAPLPGTDGCRGNECCYVLVGDCGR